MFELAFTVLVLATAAGFFGDATLYAVKFMRKLAQGPRPHRVLASIDWSAPPRRIRRLIQSAPEPQQSEARQYEQDDSQRPDIAPDVAEARTLQYDLAHDAQEVRDR